MATTPRSHREYLTLAAAAEKVGCHPRTIRRAIARGELNGYRLGRRMLRVDAAELDRAFRPVPTVGTFRR